MEIWLGVSFGLLVVGAAIVLIGVHRRREAQKLQELRRRALAKLEVTAVHKALPPDDLLTNINMSSFKKQVEIQARSRLARGSLPPRFERTPAPRPRALDTLFDDFELEEQSEPAPLH